MSHGFGLDCFSPAYDASPAFLYSVAGFGCRSAISSQYEARLPTSTRRQRLRFHGARQRLQPKKETRSGCGTPLQMNGSGLAVGDRSASACPTSPSTGASSPH